jgi:hypothetical protein
MVNPMYIFVDRQHRSLRSESHELLDDDVERPLPLRIRRQIERGVPLAGRDRKKHGYHGSDCAHILDCLREQRFQLVELLVR